MSGSGTGRADGRSAHGIARLAVLGRCGATDAQLRLGLFAARGGALRHVTAWPGSYTAVLQLGRRITVWATSPAPGRSSTPLGRAARPTPPPPCRSPTSSRPGWTSPTSPPPSPARTPPRHSATAPRTWACDAFRPGHALILRDGSPEITGYEPTASLAVGHQPDPPPPTPKRAVERRPRRACWTPCGPGSPSRGFVPDVGDGPAPASAPTCPEGRASATLALLAAGLPGMPGTLPGTVRSRASGCWRSPSTTSPAAGAGREAELERARTHGRGSPAAPRGGRRRHRDPSLRRPRPGPAHRRARALPGHRGTPPPAAAAGSADHLVGHGARQVLDAHPARLADLLMDRQRRHLVRPVAALTRRSGRHPAVLVMFTALRVYRAARRLARTPYQHGSRGRRRPVAARARFGPPGRRRAARRLAGRAWPGCGPGPRPAG